MPSLKLTKNIYILDGVRTVSSIPFKTLKGFNAAQLGSILIKALLKRTKIAKNKISQVIMGNVVSSGTGQNIARQIALLSGLAHSVNAFSVDYVCGSGLQALYLGAQSLVCGEDDFIIVGGVESITNAPFLLDRKAVLSKEKTDSIDSLKQDGLYCNLTQKRMGELAEALASEYGISREAQDNYALNSHKKACAAQEKKSFKGEIVVVNQEDSEEKDERPRKRLGLDVLSEFPAVFKEGGTVTAANSSVPCDGAACLVLATESAIKKYNLKPLAKIVGVSSVMMDPNKTFEATVAVINECLNNTQLNIKNIDLFEVAEAFAVQAIYTQEKLGIPPDKMNISGGDVALGHPLGAVGARILVTLIHALRNEKLKTGIAAVPFGGGGAIAVAVEQMR